MRRAVNTIVHGSALAVMVFGLVLMMFAAGSSDAGADLTYVGRMMAAGFVGMAGGAALHCWRI